MFPVDPRPGGANARGLFVVQTPELRSRILPLFSFDPTAPELRPVGHGTTFRVDLWSRCVTAFHVVEDLLTLGRDNVPTLKPDISLAALEMEGIILGTARMPLDSWRSIAEIFSQWRLDTPPLGRPGLRNAAELSVLRIQPSRHTEIGTPYLPVDLRNWRPSIGERVLALGYADLDRAPVGGRDDRPIHQYLYGSFGEIVDIERADATRSRPWPLIRIAASWPGGMSGGPVFNEAGHVIGVVSTGMGDIGSATYFSGWDLPPRIFGSLDPNNPGWFFFHAVFDAAGALKKLGAKQESIRRFAQAHGLTDIGIVTLDPQSMSHIRIPTQPDNADGDRR